LQPRRRRSHAATLQLPPGDCGVDCSFNEHSNTTIAQAIATATGLTAVPQLNSDRTTNGSTTRQHNDGKRRHWDIANERRQRSNGDGERRWRTAMANGERRTATTTTDDRRR